MRKLTTAHFIAALLMLLALIGCTPSAETPSTGTDQPAETGEPQQGTDEPVFRGGSGPIHLVDPTVGLNTLTTWSATLVFSVEDASGVRSETLQVARIDDLLYQRMPNDETCMISEVSTRAAVDPNTGWLTFSPAALQLPAVLGAAEVEPNHYTFNESTLALAGITTAEGEVFTHPETGAILQYYLTVEAGEEFFGEGGEGTLTWDYTLWPDSSDMPEGCEAFMADVPVMPDAEAVERRAGSLSYTSASDVLQVGEFYQAELEAAGWEVVGEPVIDALWVQLTYQKEGQVLTVNIEPSDAGSSVNVLLSEPEA